MTSKPVTHVSYGGGPWTPVGETEALSRRDALLREAAKLLDKAGEELDYGYPETGNACDALASRIRSELGES